VSVCVLALVAGAFPLVARAATPTPGTPSLPQDRKVEPVVLTGSQFPDWSAGPDLSAKLPAASPSSSCKPDPSDGIVHNCSEQPEVRVPTTPLRTGVAIDKLIGYRFDRAAGRFVQIPFQVDEKFNRYISNFASNCTSVGPFCVGFGAYAGTDQQPTYVFDRDIYKYTGGTCVATATGGPEQDPIPGLDDNDEMAFLAKDAGALAPSEAAPPTGITQMRAVRIDDPSVPGSSPVYAYVGVSDGSVKRAYDATNGYMRYVRDADSFNYTQTSDNYGNAPKGTVCDDSGNVIATNVARRPKDTAWILTPRYAFRYAGRWELRGVRVNPDRNATQPLASPDAYGPPLVDEWKARAYAQRPGDKVPCCGFENESNDDWGGSSVTMGEKVGPVRAIRTTWGADSGTNTVRTEIFYPEEIVQQTYLRVHPIPPLGGIFSYWDHTAGVITKYYNPEQSDGVAVDGVNDEVMGTDYVALHCTSPQPIPKTDCASGSPSGGVELRDDDPAFKDHPIQLGSQDGCFTECTDLDVTDPTVNATGTLAWEEVAGASGSMVFRQRLNTAPDHLSPGDAQSVLSIPYYRDDKCFDDGTGIDPGPASKNPTRPCWDPNAPTPPGGWRQGLFGAHGVQVLFTPESDNGGPVGTVPVTEVDAETRMVVLPGDAGNVGESYGHAADVPLVATPLATAAPAAPAVDQTSIAIGGDTSGIIGTAAHLSATLTDRSGAVSGATLHFTFQGLVYDATTDSHGVATVTVPVNEPAGSNHVVVDYDGDGALRPAAEAQGSFVAKRTAVLSFQPSSASSGTIGDSSTFVAKLSDAAGPIAGATLHFDFQGGTKDATTDDNGVASTSFSVSGPAGSSPAFVRFDGDDLRTDATDTTSVDVSKRASKIAFTATSGKGMSVVVNVTLTDTESGEGLGGASVDVTVAGVSKATITTAANGSGRATFTYRWPKGKSFGVSYAGNDTYDGSSATGTYGRTGASGSS